MGFTDAIVESYGLWCLQVASEFLEGPGPGVETFSRGASGSGLTFRHIGKLRGFGPQLGRSHLGAGTRQVEHFWKRQGLVLPRAFEPSQPPEGGQGSLLSSITSSDTASSWFKRVLCPQEATTDGPEAYLPGTGPPHPPALKLKWQWYDLQSATNRLQALNAMTQRFYTHP